MQSLSIRYPFRPHRRSLASGQAADLFGLTDDEAPHIVADNLTLDVQPGDLVLVTGPSGSGKSSILRALGTQLDALDVTNLQLPDAPLIDALSGPVEQRLEHLSACGLSEARLILRAPAELSDGQRHRFRLALALQSGARFLLVDEFAAALDRTLANVLAFNVRRLCTRLGTGFLLATTHDDVVDDLNPDLHVRCLGDGQLACERRDVKKKRSVSCRSFGSRRAPAATGRISLGGIIALISSPTSTASCCSGTAASRSASASSAAPRPA